MEETLWKKTPYRKLLKKYIPCYRNQTIPCDWIPQELSAGSIKKKKGRKEKERKI